MLYRDASRNNGDARMARPRIGDCPMTAAERARRYRQRRFERQRIAMRKPESATLPALLAELREAVKGGSVASVEGITRELVIRAKVNRDASRNKPDAREGEA